MPFINLAFMIRAGSLCCFVCAFVMGSFAQVKHDSSKIKKSVKENLSKLKKAISKNGDEVLVEKSEDPYLDFDGKIIRKIIVKHISFEKNIIDTARTFKNRIAKVANKLHSTTKEYVIRNNLFIKEGKPLNPYRVADNERWLRNLNYMLDARIYCEPIVGEIDSVDLLVITRDVFSLGGSFEPNYPSKYVFSLQDVNLGGRGQTVQIGQVVDETRSPKYGYKGSYLISNINGTFIDGSVGYTSLNDGVHVGNENENSLYIRLNRSLYQPFARFAGGAEISYNSSDNVFKKPDSLFASYRYTVQDYWLGYSFGHRRLPQDLKENRNRTFVALRAYDQFFLSQRNTEINEQDRFIFRNKTSLLGQLTFFRQDFYKTQYVLGFGRTEDVPYGYRISFTSGWERELGIKRPYAGSELYLSKILAGGSILTLDVNLASYFQGIKIKDGFFSVNATRFSKINRLGKMIVRHQYAGGYAAIVNQELKRGIGIRDMNGILGFLPDSLVGFQRMTLDEEVTVFTPYKILGFHLAPIVRIDLALIRRFPAFFRTENFFSGFSVGLRARNENLIFNTIEARLFFYPKTVERLEHYRFNTTVNFRIKYPTTLVNKPATVYQ
jgi:hypothetical protein